MSDPYFAMIISADTERIMGDAMIEARQAYYAALDDYASPIDDVWDPDDPSITRLSDAYEAAYTAWEQAHNAVGEALLAWLKTVT